MVLLDFLCVLMLKDIKEINIFFIYRIYFLKKEFLNLYYFFIYCCLFDSLLKFLNIVDFLRILKFLEKIKVRRYLKKRE